MKQLTYKAHQSSSDDGPLDILQKNVDQHFSQNNIDQYFLEKKMNQHFFENVEP